ncbi:MAG: CPXCG motif-containing cysteine-rich protein [Gemmatimonadaceae bacterium]
MPLDDDFPTGDGTADTEATVLCPYCAEEVTIGVDPGGGASQRYVEDCPVCCQAWQVNVSYDAGAATVDIQAIDG